MKFLKSDTIVILFMLSFIGAIILHCALLILPGYGQVLPGFISPLFLPWFACGLMTWIITGFVNWIINIKNRLKHKSPCRQQIENINDEVRVVIPVGNIVSILAACVFALIAIPHIYASCKLEPLWRKWKQTHNNDLFLERDRILHSLGFDYSTSLRFWEGPFSGLYMPQSYLKAFGIPQNKVFLPNGLQ